MKKFNNIITSSTEETQKLGSEFSKLLKPGDIIALVGNLAAGKTTFIKGVLKGLGYQYEVTSPTFSFKIELYLLAKPFILSTYLVPTEVTVNLL